MVRRVQVTEDGEVVPEGIPQVVVADTPPFVLPRAPGTYDSDAVSRATAYVETMESKTEQADEASSNINSMIQRLGIEEVTAQGYFGPFEADFTSAPGSFQEAKNKLLAAERAFASLPARVRSRFANDPGELLEFLERSDEEAMQEAVDLGLISKRPTAGSAAAAAGGAGAPIVPPPATTPAGGGEKPA